MQRARMGGTPATGVVAYDTIVSGGASAGAGGVAAGAGVASTGARAGVPRKAAGAALGSVVRRLSRDRLTSSTPRRRSAAASAPYSRSMPASSRVRPWRPVAPKKW